MKSRIKYIIFIMLAVLLTAPQWYYAFTDKNRQSDYGTQEVSLSPNKITAAQFFTLMRSENATKIQVHNIYPDINADVIKCLKDKFKVIKWGMQRLVLYQKIYCSEWIIRGLYR